MPKSDLLIRNGIGRRTTAPDSVSGRVVVVDRVGDEEDAAEEANAGAVIIVARSAGQPVYVL